MSFALKELSRLLNDGGTLIGVVVAVENGLVRVATERGAMTVSSAEPLSAGSRVLIRNGTAFKAPVARQTYPV